MEERVATEQLPIEDWINLQVSKFARQKREEILRIEEKVLIEMCMDRQLYVYSNSGPIMMSGYIKEENRGAYIFWRASRTRVNLSIESYGHYFEYSSDSLGNGTLPGGERLVQSVIVNIRNGRYNERSSEHKLREALEVTWDYAQGIGRQRAQLIEFNQKSPQM